MGGAKYYQYFSPFDFDSELNLCLFQSVEVRKVKKYVNAGYVASSVSYISRISDDECSLLKNGDQKQTIIDKKFTEIRDIPISDALRVLEAIDCMNQGCKRAVGVSRFDRAHQTWRQSMKSIGVNDSYFIELVTYFNKAISAQMYTEIGGVRQRWFLGLNYNRGKLVLEDAFRAQ